MKRLVACILILILALTSVAFAETTITNLPELTKQGSIDFSKMSDDELTLLAELLEIEQSNRHADKAPVDTSSATMGEKNALGSAESYLTFMAFSYTGLIKQLEYEGFSTDEATYAADHCGADWKEQAAKSAESYLSYMSFSKSGLIDQLVYEGFTKEQAEYGAKKNGY